MVIETHRQRKNSNKAQQGARETRRL